VNGQRVFGRPTRSRRSAPVGSYSVSSRVSPWFMRTAWATGRCPASGGLCRWVRADHLSKISRSPAWRCTGARGRACSGWGGSLGSSRHPFYHGSPARRPRPGVVAAAGATPCPLFQRGRGRAPRGQTAFALVTQLYSRSDLCAPRCRKRGLGPVPRDPSFEHLRIDWPDLPPAAAGGLAPDPALAGAHR